MRTVIYEKRLSGAGWFALALGFIGASAIILMGGRNMIMGMSVLIGVSVALVAITVALTGMLNRYQVARMTLNNGELEAELFHLWGRGQTLHFHDTQTSNWRWKSRPASGVRNAVMAFTYNGQEYTMPFGGAHVVNHSVFKEIAPFLLWA